MIAADRRISTFHPAGEGASLDIKEIWDQAMNWDEFERAAAAFIANGDMAKIEDVFLDEKTVFHDNATRHREHATGKQINATAQDVFDIDADGVGFSFGGYDGSDFVYFHPRETMRVSTMLEGGGGHPCLAGMDMPSGAGRILDNGFFFHSGHFRPTLKEGLAFFCQFVRNSCANLAGDARDLMVDRLSEMTLEYYIGRTSRTSSTTLARLAAPYLAEESSSDDESAPPSPRQAPGTSAASHHARGRQLASSGSFRRQSSEEITGVTPPGTYLAMGRNDGRANWMPNSEARNCLCCNRKFHTFLRRHHCRKCGNVVCDRCSKTRKVVRNPAVEKPADAVAVTPDPVRVCDTCKGLIDA